MGAKRRRLLRLLGVFAAVALLLGTAFVGYVSWRSAESLVHPARQVPPYTPASVGLSYANVSFASADGIDLRGWWIPSGNHSRGTVVFLHGYADSKNQSLGVAPFLHEGGYHVLAFDFRAHGESGGAFTTVGLDEVLDVQAAVAWLATRDEANASRVALMGYSMGAAAALNAAGGLQGVEAVVADSAFATLENIASNSITHFTGLPAFPFGFLSVAFAAWIVDRSVGDNRPVEAAARLDLPVLVIQGEADRIAFPDEDGGAIAASLRQGEYWLVPGAGHVEARHKAGEAYARRVLTFLDAHVVP